MNNHNSAFAEEIQSLFIVQTPFQAMCAINAIRQLHIKDYTLSLHLHKSTEKRNKQTVEIVERYGLKYHIEDLKPLSLKDRMRLMFERNGKYNRVFLGTHLYQEGYYYALKELKNNSNLVLLDDGIATLSLLESGYQVKGRSVAYMALYKTIASLRGIIINNVLTVYRGVDNPKWNIELNDISQLRQPGMSAERKNVFFIGTNNSGFIREGVNENSFKENLYNCLKRVKKEYPLDDIIYIPHGRDKSEFAKKYCVEMGIEYKPLDVNVEIYILSLGYIPKAIYGFTSSALYNLKKIFPESEVNNIVMRLLTVNSPSILEASGYYEKQGISAIYV